MPEIPLAVAPSVRTPQTAVLVDLTSGPPSPASGTLRAIIVAPLTTSGGSLSAGALKQGVSGPDEVGTLLGVGGLGHLTALALFAEYGIAQCDVAAVADITGVAASGTFTFVGSPTALRVVKVLIAGRIVTTYWDVGETATQGASRLSTEINKLTNGSSLAPPLPVTASPAVGVVTVTFKQKGTAGNDCLISCTAANGLGLIGGAGGTLTASGTALTGGTGAADYSSIHSIISGIEYDLLLEACGNTDVVDATSTGVAGRMKTYIEANVSGGEAKLQQFVLACTSSTNGSLKTATAAHDYERGQFLLARDACSLPCEFMGARAGQRLREYSINPNKNVVGLTFKATLYGPLDLATGAPTAAELEDDAQNGIAPVKYTAAGVPILVAHFTSYFKDANGYADDRVLFDTVTTSCDAIARDLRRFLPATFPNVNVIDTVPDGTEIPEGCITVDQAEAAVASRIEGYWVPRGIVNPNKWATLKANGEYIVRQNPTDGHQVDVVVPASIIPHLTKWSLAVLNRQ